MNKYKVNRGELADCSYITVYRNSEIVATGAITGKQINDVEIERNYRLNSKSRNMIIDSILKFANENGLIYI